ncbi:hypothetical protein, partial [Paenibacillus dendritiformis]|uniref:hypothetical protein n=1 Tax=Paenibacillus dendritiformis TaxID=130049 RepID=UPI001BCA7853
CLIQVARWNAVCGESRMHGVEVGKRWRAIQSLTYTYSASPNYESLSKYILKDIISQFSDK